MTPLHFQQGLLGQQRPTTASNNLKNGSATGATLAFNGFATGPYCKPVPLPFRCHWGIFGGWNFSSMGSELQLIDRIVVKKYICKQVAFSTSMHTIKW